MEINWRLKWGRVGASLLLGVYLSVNPVHAVVPEDRVEILGMLREGRFDQLDSRFKRYFDEYQTGKNSDQVLDHAYYAFRNADPDLKTLLDNWVAARAKSSAARIARANQFLTLAWLSRRYRWARETTDAQFARMRGYLTLSATDLHAALKLNPRIGIAYGGLIEIAMMDGSGEAVHKLVRRGLKLDPRSFAIRNQYLSSLRPWWHIGKGQEHARHAIAQFLEEIKRDVGDNTALAPLQGFGIYVIAESYARQRRHVKAIEYYDEALRFGNHNLYLQGRGTNYYQLKRYQDAIADFTRALELRPQVSGILNERARSYRKLNQLDRAFKDWDSALAIDPFNPDILRQKAYGLRDAKRYTEALSILDRAVLYGADDRRVWDARGRLLLYQLKRPEEAAADFRQALEINPGSARYSYFYGVALYRTKDCKAAEVLASYRNICEAGGNCPSNRLNWAARVIEYMKNPRVCPAVSK